MARKKASVELSDFTKGFITEASPLTFPENSSIDEDNMNINRDGSRQRRFGMNWSDVADEVIQTTPLSVSGLAVSSYSWFSAGNDGTQNLGILQKGSVLYFYDLDAEDVSQTLLTTYTSGAFIDPLVPVEYTNAYGKLIVVGGGEDVLVLTWNGVSVSPEVFRINVRDRWGAVDGLAVDEHPTILTANHQYNLRNQGFPVSMLCAGNEFGNAATVMTDPVDYTFLKLSPQIYPSNVDLVWSNKIEAISGTLTDNIGTYSPWEIAKQLFGTTPAPKGKSIIDLFKRNQTPVSSVIGRKEAMAPLIGSITEDFSTGVVSSVSSFSGRVWYTVFEKLLTGGDALTPNIGSMVFYSQATEDLSRWGACHTRNDPTAEILNDVLASDGGFISLPEAGEILKTVPLGESLFVFATNGVWEIFGGDTTFSATAQSVLKVTDRGCVSKKSIVVGENLIGYWSDTGIYGISLSETNLRGISTNITETTIQDYYDDIPVALKKNALGSFDSIARQVIWLYNLSDTESDYYFEKELVFDLNKTAFTKRSIDPLIKTSGHGPYITASLALKSLLADSTQEDVTDGGVTITAGGVNITTTVSDAEQGTKSSLMYWLADYNGTSETFRLGGYLDFTFTDYPRIQDSLGNFGSDAAAFILTGYTTGGDSSRIKRAPYITTKLKKTESDWVEDGSGNITVVGESSCTLQAQWQWTNSALSGYWSVPQQVYRLPRFFTLDSSHNFSFDVVNTRSKVKGSGEALSLKFSSEPLKDMILLGWGLEIEMDEQV